MSKFGGSRRLFLALFGSVTGGIGAVAAASIFTVDSKTHNENVCKAHGENVGGVAWSGQVRQKWDDNWDRRSPRAQKIHHHSKTTENAVGAEDNQQPSRPTASRHIILIRHGQYNTSASSDNGRCLTELGREQAELCGARLRDLNLPFTRLITSTLTRAIETGDIISKYLNPSLLPIQRCSMLKEGAPIEPEPPVGHYHPEASQYYEDGARIEAAFRNYIHRADIDQKQDSYDVLVCHGNVIRYFVCRALQLPPEAWLRIGLNNGSISWLTVRPSGRVHLRVLGDSLFMPTNKISSG